MRSNTPRGPNPLSNAMSPKSKELLMELLASILRENVELVLKEYIGVEMTTTMQDELQLELDELVEMWVEYNMVNEGLRLHANYVGEPPMLDTNNPIRKVILNLPGISYPHRGVQCETGAE